MGPPPRSLAVEANDCFMVSGLCRPNRIQGCGAHRASKRASLGSFILDQQERRRPREMNLDRGVPIQGCVKTQAFNLLHRSGLAPPTPSGGGGPAGPRLGEGERSCTDLDRAGGFWRESRLAAGSASDALWEKWRMTGAPFPP